VLQPVSEDQWRADHNIEVWQGDKLDALRRTGIIARAAVDTGARLILFNANSCHLNANSCHLNAIFLPFRLILPGNTPEMVDLAVDNYAVANNAYPSALNYRGFPKAIPTQRSNSAALTPIRAISTPFHAISTLIHAI